MGDTYNGLDISTKIFKSVNKLWVNYGLNVKYDSAAKVLQYIYSI